VGFEWKRSRGSSVYYLYIKGLDLATMGVIGCWVYLSFSFLRSLFFIAARAAC
jgi:hypothetical protein